MEGKHPDWSEDQYNFDSRRLRVSAAEEDDPDYEGDYHHAVPPLRTARLEASGALPSAVPRTESKPEVACLVKGCNADLSTSKAYYRRFRICEAHMKSMSLSIEGRSCRFCQQCGKFHLVEEFDGANRNCRKALMIRFYKRRNMPLGTVQASVDRSEQQSGLGDAAELRLEPRKRGRPRAPRPNITEDDPNAAALAAGGSPPPGLVGNSAAARAAAAAGFDSTLQAAYIAASRGYQGSSGLGVTPATAIGPPGYSQGGVRMAGIQVEQGLYDNDSDSDEAPPRRRRSKGAPAGAGGRRGSSRDPGLGGGAGIGSVGSGSLDLGGGQLDLNLLAGGGLQPLGDAGLGGLGAGGFDGLGGRGLPGLTGIHGGGLGARGTLGAGPLGGLDLGGGGLGLGDLGLPLSGLGGAGAGRGGAGAGLGSLGGLGLRGGGGGGLLDVGPGAGRPGGGLLLDNLATSGGGAAGLLPSAGQSMRLMLQPPLEGRRGVAGGNGNQPGFGSGLSEQQQDAPTGLLVQLARGAGAARGTGLGQAQGATPRDAAEALAALATSGRLDVQVLLAAAAAAASGGGSSTDQQAALASLLAELPGGAELLASQLLPGKQLQDLDAGSDDDRPLPLALERLQGRAGLLPMGLPHDHDGLGDLGLGRLGNGGARPRLPLDVGGAVRPLGGGLAGLERGRGVGLELGAVGAGSGAAGGGRGPLAGGLLGPARGRGGSTDMEFGPLRLDGGLQGAAGGPGRMAATAAAGHLLSDDDVAAGGGAGGVAELSLADLLGQMSIPQQLELLMGLPQQQMMEVLKQLPHTQQVELLLALQADRQNRVAAERAQEQQDVQQAREQPRQQPGAGNPPQQVIMLGAQGVRVASGAGPAGAASGAGSGQQRPLVTVKDEAVDNASLLESLAAGARLNLAPIGAADAVRGEATHAADAQAAAKALAALQRQDGANGEQLTDAGQRAKQVAGKPDDAPRTGAASAAAGGSNGLGLAPPARGTNQEVADRALPKPEAAQHAVKASGGTNADSPAVSSGPAAAAAPAAKEQREQHQRLQQLEEQPKSEGNNAAGQASRRGGDEDSGKEDGGRPAAATSPPAGGATADASGDTSAARRVEADGGADALGVDAAYKCEEALERLSLKLHGVRPEDLAPNVAQRMRNWLQSMDAVTLQGTLRSGCVNLVLDVSYRQGQAEASSYPQLGRAWTYRLAAAAIASSLGLELTGEPAAASSVGACGQCNAPEATGCELEYGLCRKAAALAAARGVRVQVQIGTQVVYPRHEQDQQQVTRQQQAAEVHELAPLAVVQGEHAVLLMAGRDLDNPAARLHVRLNGRRLGVLVQPQRDLQQHDPQQDPQRHPLRHPQGEEGEQDGLELQHCEDASVLVFLDVPSQAGLAVLEWEAGGGAGVLGDWWPLVVAPDADVAAELNALALNHATAHGSGPEWLRALLVDVGLVLDAALNVGPPSGLHAALEPGVLERLVRRARCLLPFCETRMMAHTAAVVRAFLEAAAAETDMRAPGLVAAAVGPPSRASSSTSSACGSDFSDSEQEQENISRGAVECATVPPAEQFWRTGGQGWPGSPCQLNLWPLGLALSEAA